MVFLFKDIKHFWLSTETHIKENNHVEPHKKHKHISLTQRKYLQRYGLNFALMWCWGHVFIKLSWVFHLHSSEVDTEKSHGFQVFTGTSYSVHCCSGLKRNFPWKRYVQLLVSSKKSMSNKHGPRTLKCILGIFSNALFDL